MSVSRLECPGAGPAGPLPGLRAGRGLALAAGLALGAHAGAADVGPTSVSHDGGRYLVRSSFVVPLPEGTVRSILTDYQNLPRLNPDIERVELLAPGDRGELRMRVESRVCVLFFCRSYVWVQEVMVSASGDIVSRFDPALSDFAEGQVRYSIEPEEHGTRVTVEASLVPDPPPPALFGALMMRYKLRREALHLGTALEAAALGNED